MPRRHSNLTCIVRAKQALLDVLNETRGLLSLPDNDFNWSTWSNATEALSEIDGFISLIKTGGSFDGSQLSILFAPTGDIQEVSMSSGWGDRFCQVARRFESAFDEYKKAGTT